MINQNFYIELNYKYSKNSENILNYKAELLKYNKNVYIFL